MTWLLHFLGIDTTTSIPGRFWPGFGSDLGEVAIIGGLASIYQHHRCHVHHCWRLARHPVAGTPHVVCRRHHPDGPLLARHLTGSKM